MAAGIPGLTWGSPVTNLLVVPKSMIQEGYTPPPLGLLNVAAMDTGTYIIDNANEPTLDVVSVFKYVRPRIVGVPIYTAGRVEALRLLKAAKEAGAITVAGGPHVSIMHEQLAAHYPFIDHLVVGDGELAWKEITSGTKVQRVIKMRVPRFDDLPIPAWARIDLNRYPARGEGIHRGNDLGKIPRISVVLGRGCIGSCSFCLIDGTYVIMGDGSEKVIESINKGESVKTANGKIGIVTGVFRREATRTVTIELESGKSITVTPEHPVLTRNRGWVIAAQLTESDDVVEENNASKSD